MTTSKDIIESSIRSDAILLSKSMPYWPPSNLGSNTTTYAVDYILGSGKSTLPMV